MGKIKNETEYFKCAMHRLRDAEKLMELTNSSSGAQKAIRLYRRRAIYIAGYGVECMLKAYMIHTYNCKTLSEAADRIRQNGISVGQIDKGSAGHNMIHLYNISLLDNYLANEHREDMEICKTGNQHGGMNIQFLTKKKLNVLL